MSDPTVAAEGTVLETPGAGLGASPETEAKSTGKPHSLWSDAWRELRHNWIFWIASALILLFLVMAAFPQLFTGVDPFDAKNAILSRSKNPPDANSWMGYDLNGDEIYPRVIYGARASIIVGLGATLTTVLIGSVMGLLAGFYGGWIDALMSRIADVFFGLPFILGGIVVMNALKPESGSSSEFVVMIQVISTLALLSWPVTMRIMRSAVISAKNLDYVKAARALGATNRRIIFRHMLPNTVASVLVYASVALGVFIGAEATLTFLGIGLRSPVISWGIMISDSKDYLRVAPHMLLFPAGALGLTVLSFVMLGEAVREALDPKLR